MADSAYSGRVYVVGAGLSGLAAAVALAGRGRAVTVFEAAGHAGGRCRSYHDATLDRRIDNGNHLILSGNTAIVHYLREIGTGGGLGGPARAEFPFFDLRTGQRWTVRPNAGPIPWWMLAPSRRVPETTPLDYLKALRLARAKPTASVSECLGGDGPAFARFWGPLAVSVLNTAAEEAAAALLWPVVRETFLRGEAACRPRMAAVGLSECFIDPALAYLDRAGAPVRLHHRLRRFDFVADRVAGLHFGGGEAVAIGAGDAVIMALPPTVAGGLLPRLEVPRSTRAIVNGHFLLPSPVDGVSLVGLIGGVCHWLFLRGDVASVTVSAADDLCDQPSDVLAATMWTEIARVLDVPVGPPPAHRIVKEKRATFAQTPEEIARRPGTRTAFANVFLAGDWTDTGLPATLEGSVRSGNTAAEAVARMWTSP